MEAITVNEILKACNGHLQSGDSGTKVAGISTDTRTIKEGEMFLAVKGQKYDGHSFIAEAFRKKAAGAIVSGLAKELPKGKILILVRDTLSALQNIAGYYRDKFTLPVIAITGSNGKTTTKEMLAAILSQKLKTLRSQASFNNQIGVPLSLLQISSQDEVCILEIGMNRSGEVRHLAAIAKPDIGIITNTGSAHMGNLGSLREIAMAKAELLEKVSGTCILNADDQHYQILRRRCTRKTLTFGLKKEADFHADSIVLLSSGLSFRVNGKFEVRLPVAGEHNVYNALASIATSSCFNIGEEYIRRGLKTFQLPPWRGEVRKCGTVQIINDAYNANPDSMKAAIELLADKKGRKILVIADMLELGDEAGKCHGEIGAVIAHSDIDVLFTMGDFARISAQAALREGMKKVFACRTKQELIKKLLSELKPYDIMLVKGSREMRMEEVVQALQTEVAAKLR